MKARMKNPGIVIPDAMTAIRSLNDAVQQGGVPQRTLDLIHLRASQINGCAVCLGAATHPPCPSRQLIRPAHRGMLPSRGDAPPLTENVNSPCIQR